MAFTRNDFIARALPQEAVDLTLQQQKQAQADLYQIQTDAMASSDKAAMAAGYLSELESARLEAEEKLTWLREALRHAHDDLIALQSQQNQYQPQQHQAQQDLAPDHQQQDFAWQAHQQPMTAGGGSGSGAIPPADFQAAQAIMQPQPPHGAHAGGPASPQAPPQDQFLPQPPQFPPQPPQQQPQQYTPAQWEAWHIAQMMAEQEEKETLRKQLDQLQRQQAEMEEIQRLQQAALMYGQRLQPPQQQPPPRPAADGAAAPQRPWGSSAAPAAAYPRLPPMLHPPTQTAPQQQQPPPQQAPLPPLPPQGGATPGSQLDALLTWLLMHGSPAARGLQPPGPSPP